MPFEQFVEVIKAIGHEPLGFYSLVFLILGFLTARLIARMGKKPSPSEVALLLAIILLGFSGMALAIVRADNKVTEQRQQVQTQNYTALIKFEGQRTTLQQAQVAFRNSSGQVNFDCGDTRQASVSWTAPAGAQQINATATWLNTDHVKSQDQRVLVNGSTATATGMISGDDRDWLGNCHGGGHGELVIQGTYVIEQPIAGAPFESIQSGTVSKDKPFTVPLPSEEGLQITSSEATMISSGAQPIVLRVAPVPPIGSSEVRHDDKGPVELVVSGKEATLGLIK